MGLVQKLRLSLCDRRRSARRSRRTALGVERLDERIALAVDQLWVQPGSPMSTDDPTGAATNPFHSLEEAQATIRAQSRACSPFHKPGQPGVMRASGLTQVISANTKEAPPMALAPKCIK